MAIKIGLADAPPFQLVTVRFFVALTVVIGLIYARGFQLPNTWREWVWIGYPGLFLFGFAYAAVYFAEQYISSSLTAVLFGAEPFWIALLSVWLLTEERLPGIAWVGIGLGFIGVVLISYDQLQISGDLFVGTLISLGGALAAGYGTIAYKKYHTGGDILVTIAVQMIAGLLLLLPMALIFEDFGDFHVTPGTVGSILYLALPSSVGGFMMYFWLLRRLKAVTVALTGFVTPIVATLIGVVFFDEHLTSLVVAGAAMVLCGVLLVIGRKAPAPSAPTAG